MRMRMSTVYLVRRTLGILVVILVLVSLYWNYKLHATKKKQFSQPSLESLTQRDEVSALKKGKISSHKNRGTTTTKSAVTHATTRGAPTRLLQKLSQLEARLNQSHAVSMIIFHDPENVLRSKDSLYGLSLEKQGYKVKVVSNLSEDGPDSMISSSWSGIMCYSQRQSGSHPCLNKKSLTKLKLHQKVSYIPGLDKILILPDKFCYTMSAAHHLPALTSSPLSVPCSVSPSKSISEKVFKSLDNSTLFLIKPSEEASPLITFTRMLTVERMLQIKGVLHAIRHPLFIDSQPVIIKVYVLITSMTPLRVFRHHDGSAVIMTQDKGIKETWTLHQLDVYLSESFSANDVSRAWSQVDEMIVKSLMISESSLLGDKLKMELLSQSSNFFHLLEFYFTFNSSLHPFLLEVKPTLDGSTSPDVVRDTIQLVFGATSSVRHVHEMLQKENKTIGVEGLYCSQQHKICLDDSELVYVIENHRQATALGRFKKLYPTSESNKYQQLLDDLVSSDDDSLDSRLKTHKRRSTPQLHSVLTEMESYREGFASDGDVPHVDQRKGYWETDDDDYPDKISPDSSSNVQRQSRPKCNEDSSADPVLTAIYIDPTSADFTPAFTPEITEYDVTFPFDVAVVKIWGATTCGSEARVNSVTGTSGAANYSVGVGWNKFAIHLVDTSLAHPSVIGTYNINIYRRGRSNQHKPFSDSATTHEMCSLKQDCDLKAFPGLPCGPQKIPEKTMNEFLESRVDLPWCENGDAPGSWVFPCANCSDPSSCFWREAKWTPDSCTHNILSNKDAKTCLASKKILFVGDSTNRGIMYYLMEKINGSLQQWEKTHSMKVYSSALNDGKTSVSFAYYPQFWLPPDRKPVFLKALQHLMARFMPLTNSTDTILVVGGVQWLLPSHVIAIKTTVSSLGLGGIKVIIKTLGSGFHLPVPGFVKLNLEGQQKVAQRNQMVMKAARTAGFEVVDTHAMTVAR
ncbi:cadherin-like and PC-esterase domain-containing protein 1 isoform X2 [Actinia tenebrosa]|nr:cadherin-like and PC-esterase domain-containing protein 1 isoform X2 [Actinia tenebrosa]